MTGRHPPVVYVCLALILCVAVFLRFYRLSEIPPGLHVDEAFFANVAYCLLNTGRDLEGNYLPLVSQRLHFIAILPLQIYPNVVSVYAFGLNEFAVRFIPAMLGVLIVLLSFLLGRLLFNDFVGLLAALLVSVAPWHVTYSRIGFANLLPTTFLFLMGLYLLLKGLRGERRHMLLGAVALGLTFFSYFLAHVYVPLFLFGLYYILYDRLKSGGKLGFYCISILVVGLFLIASFLVWYDKGGAINTKPAGSLAELWSNLIEALGVILSSKSGWVWPVYPGEPGVLYPVCIPFLLLGVILLLLRRDYAGFLLVYWLTLSLVVGALSSSVVGGSVRRIFVAAGPVFELIVAYSVYRVSVFYWNSRKVLFLLTAVASIGLFLGVCGFLSYYFVQQPGFVESERFFEYPLKELFSYTESVKDRYDAVVFDSELKSRVCVSNNSGGQNAEKAYVVCNLGFEDYLMFYTKKCPINSKYVFGNLSSYPLDGRNLFVTREISRSNKTPVKVIRYSDGEIAYSLIA